MVFLPHQRSVPAHLEKVDFDHQAESIKMHWTEDEFSSHAYSKIREKGYKEKTYNSSISSYSDQEDRAWLTALASRSTDKKKRENMKKKSKASIISTSISSVNSDDETNHDLFTSPPNPDSSHDNVINPLKAMNVEEEETLNRRKKTAAKQKNQRTRRFKRFGSKDWKDGVVTAISELSTDDYNKSREEKTVFRRMPIPSMGNGKGKNSFVVLKKSVDPYEDFKNSMLEMILEKQIFEPTELEQLLMSFLSLNSRIYHRVISEAFTDIWKELLCGPSN